MPNDPTSQLEFCTTSQLKALLGLAADTGATPPSVLGSLRGEEDLLPLVAELIDGSERSARDLLSTLAAAGTSLPVLANVKNRAKEMLSGAGSEPLRVAATILYHAAIAAAFARHGANISSVPLDSRSGLFEDLSSALGGTALGGIFRDAADRLATDTDPA